MRQSFGQQVAYWRNASKYKARAKVSTRMYAARNRAYVADWFSSHPCVDCGEGDPIVLQFDHIAGRGRKKGNVADGLRKWSLATLIAEIAKCEVRCANCHQRRSKTEEHWKNGQGQTLGDVGPQLGLTFCDGDTTNGRVS